MTHYSEAQLGWAEDAKTLILKPAHPTQLRALLSLKHYFVIITWIVTRIVTRIVNIRLYNIMKNQTKKTGQKGQIRQDKRDKQDKQDKQDKDKRDKRDKRDERDK